MALRLGEYVVYAEIYNTKNYATHGLIALRGQEVGQETIVNLDLTGNCDPDLRGKAFRFWPEKEDEEAAVFDKSQFPGFRDQQIGPTGTMTAQGWVRTLICPVEEFTRRAKLGEPPPTEWKRRLYLEWDSQNGRVVIEMAGAIVEQCIRLPKGKHDKGEWAPLPNLALPPCAMDERTPAGPEITVVRRDEEGIHTETWTPYDPAPEEGYPSIPEALQDDFDDEAAEIDRAIRRESADDDDDFQRELELMDHCIEEGEGKPVGLLLPNADKLPPPETLDDAQVESQLKALLAQMAMIGVALNVCEHFTPRDCYRLLLDTILPEARAHDELIGTGWVHHMATWEYCPRCEDEYYEARDSTPDKLTE